MLQHSAGNIALSPEEEGILLELKSYSSRKSPFFITWYGLGSGKKALFCVYSIASITIN